jgi:hypothetical protein
MVVGLLLLLAMLWLRSSADATVSVYSLKDERKKDVVQQLNLTRLLGTWPLLVAALVASALVVAIAVRNQLQLEDQARTDIGNTLKSVLNSTHKAAHMWLREAGKEARIWGQHEDVAGLVSELVALGADRDALIHSAAQTAIQMQLGHLLNEKDYLGFLVVNPDGLDSQIASALAT